MGKRLDDTAGVVAMTPYESQSLHYSKTTRKIDNGYVTSEHKSDSNDPDGPVHKEVFTRSHPDLDDAGEMSRNGSAMKRAVEFMKK
jgi:hypothetical protein